MDRTTRASMTARHRSETSGRQVSPGVGLISFLGVDLRRIVTGRSSLVEESADPAQSPIEVGSWRLRPRLSGSSPTPAGVATEQQGQPPSDAHSDLHSHTNCESAVYVLRGNAPEEVVLALRKAEDLPIGPDGKMRGL